MKNHIFDDLIDSINFYFILGIPTNILFDDFKIYNESEKKRKFPGFQYLKVIYPKTKIIDVLYLIIK